MNQALAMSVAFTAATSSVVNDTLQSRQNCANTQAQLSIRQDTATVIENFFQHALVRSDSSSLARARSFEEMAELYKKKAQPEMALQHYRYAIDIRQRTLGEGDPQLVADLRASSELAEDAGDTKEANELMQQAIEICKRQADPRL